MPGTTSSFIFHACSNCWYVCIIIIYMYNPTVFFNHKLRLNKTALKQELPFLALRVLLQRVEKIPSIQSLVATSKRPNIWGAVMALGFILISLWGSPHSVMAFIRMWMQQVFPAPLGPRVIIPCRTLWVSNSYMNVDSRNAIFPSQMSIVIKIMHCFYRMELKKHYSIY